MVNLPIRVDWTTDQPDPASPQLQPTNEPTTVDWTTDQPDSASHIMSPGIGSVRLADEQVGRWVGGREKNSFSHNRLYTTDTTGHDIKG